jgi:4'-phosphopantetheinyl transferase
VRPRSAPDPGVLEVWQARLGEHLARLPALAAVLSADERERADRFHRRADAEAFVLRRGILRELLGGYLGMEPAAISFSYGRWGKPSVEGPLAFNASSAGDVAMYAFAAGRAVGVDIERLRRLPDMDEVATRITSPREAAEYFAVGDRVAAFYAIWTQKEAYVKAQGDGFAAPLDAFAVPLRVSAGTATVVGDRRIEVLPASPGYAAAVAADGDNWRVRYGRYSAATRLGTTIPHASSTSSRISRSSIASIRTHAQL